MTRRFLLLPIKRPSDTSSRKRTLASQLRQRDSLSGGPHKRRIASDRHHESQPAETQRSHPQSHPAQAHKGHSRRNGGALCRAHPDSRRATADVGSTGVKAPTARAGCAPRAAYGPPYGRREACHFLPLRLRTNSTRCELLNSRSSVKIAGIETSLKLSEL